MNTHHKIASGRSTAFAWLGLIVLTVVSLLVTHQDGAGVSGISGSALLVAALAWSKAQIVARRFLELGQAGRVFQWVVNVFALFAPLGLIAVAFVVNRSA